MPKRLSREQVINQFKLVHSANRYDYSYVTYINDNTKVTIVCPSHGPFQQTPFNHKRGQRCPRCKIERQIERNKKTANTADRAIEAFRSVHGSSYDYSQVIYKNNNTKVTIVCPSHGPFQQTPANHSSGQGCPKCNGSKGERKIARILEQLSIPYVEQHKFSDCINPLTHRKLRFDFFLPNHNVVVEYDGVQHYRFIKDFHKTQKSYKEMVFRDTVKDEYCHKNNITMLRIRYTDDALNIINTTLGAFDGLS